jgi:hypothetical protein
VGRLADAAPVAQAARIALAGMDAAFMSFERRERGIHALRPGAGGARVTETRSRSRFRGRATPSPTTIRARGAATSLATYKGRR